MGMHRSGTSAFARMLNILGAELPAELVAASPGDNPLGFWEPAEAVRINERALAGVGCNWIDPSSAEDADTPQLRKAIAKFLLNCYSSDAPVSLVKDPRLSRLGGAWRKAARRIGRHPTAFVLIRNPSETAQSLFWRNRLPPDLSALSWLRHTLDALTQFPADDTILLRYDHVLRDWESVLGLIAEKANLPASRTMKNQIRGWLRPGERHFHLEPTAGLSRNQLLWRALDVLSYADNGLLDAKLQLQLKGLQQELNSWERPVRDLIRKSTREICQAARLAILDDRRGSAAAAEEAKLA